MAINLIEYKSWELTTFARDKDYELLLQFHYDLVARSITYDCGSYTSRFLREFKGRLRELRLAAGLMAAQKAQETLPDYAHQAVVVMRGVQPLAVLDPIRKAPLGQKNIELPRDCEDRYRWQEWIDLKLLHYEGVGRLTGALDDSAPRVILIFRANYIARSKRPDRVWVPAPALGSDLARRPLY